MNEVLFQADAQVADAFGPQGVAECPIGEKGVEVIFAEIDLPLPFAVNAAYQLVGNLAIDKVGLLFPVLSGWYTQRLVETGLCVTSTKPVALTRLTRPKTIKIARANDLRLM